LLCGGAPRRHTTTLGVLNQFAHRYNFSQPQQLKSREKRITIKKAINFSVDRFLRIA
jgi:hypothetical protein